MNILMHVYVMRRIKVQLDQYNNACFWYKLIKVHLDQYDNACFWYKMIKVHLHQYNNACFWYVKDIITFILT